MFDTRPVSKSSPAQLTGLGGPGTKHYHALYCPPANRIAKRPCVRQGFQVCGDQVVLGHDGSVGVISPEMEYIRLCTRTLPGGRSRQDSFPRKKMREIHFTNPLAPVLRLLVDAVRQILYRYGNAILDDVAG